MNWHARTGLTPGFALINEDFGCARTVGLRICWSAWTFTYSKIKKMQKPTEPTQNEFVEAGRNIYKLYKNANRACNEVDERKFIDACSSIFKKTRGMAKVEQYVRDNYKKAIEA